MKIFKMKLEYFIFLGIKNLDIKLIEFKSSTLWMDKLKNLRREKSFEHYLHVGHRFHPSFRQ